MASVIFVVLNCTPQGIINKKWIICIVLHAHYLYKFKKKKEKKETKTKCKCEPKTASYTYKKKVDIPNCINSLLHTIS